MSYKVLTRTRAPGYRGQAEVGRWLPLLRWPREALLAGGPPSPSATLYCHLPPSQVIRRFRDFVWLQKRLRREFRGAR